VKRLKILDINKICSHRGEMGVWKINGVKMGVFGRN